MIMTMIMGKGNNEVSGIEEVSKNMKFEVVINYLFSDPSDYA